jgi:hypothetical protein
VCNRDAHADRSTTSGRRTKGTTILMREDYHGGADIVEGEAKAEAEATFSRRA